MKWQLTSSNMYLVRLTFLTVVLSFMSHRYEVLSSGKKSSITLVASGFETITQHR